MKAVPATLKQVASAAGVSVNTASAVMRGRSRDARISEALTTHVRSVAASLRYRPNAGARSTRTGRFGGVGLVMSTTSRLSGAPSSLLRGIHDELAARDLHLATTYLPDDRLVSDDAAPKILRELLVDGLLVNYTHQAPPRMLELIDQSGVPAVWLNTKRDHDCVRPDDLGAALAATNLLLSRGVRRIAWADFTHSPRFPVVHHSATDRRSGYTQAMLAAGLTPRYLTDGLSAAQWECSPFELADQMLDDADRPEAVIGYADTSVAPFHAAALRRGLRLGRDLSLISFDERPSPLLHPRVTTMCLPHEQIGRAAARMIDQRIRNPQHQPAVVLPLTLDEAGTCPRP